LLQTLKKLISLVVLAYCLLFFLEELEHILDAELQIFVFQFIMEVLAH
jgi:hypothetical protein